MRRVECCLLAMLLGSCGSADHAAHSRPIEFIVGNDAETLDPRYSVDAVGLKATRLLHAGLVRLDENTLAPMPYAAESWRFVDALTLRVELKKNLRFHSGAALTSHDVVATLRAFASPAVGSRHARVVEAIASAEEDGPYALTIELAHPHGTLLTDLELPVLRADQASGPPRPEGGLDGLGPFALERWEHGAIALSPAPAGTGVRTAHHPVVLRTVHDENARALRIVAGRADVAQSVLSPAILPTFASQLVRRPGANLTYLLMRVDRGPLAEVGVRRAMAKAIDRDTIVRTLLGGYAETATTLMPPGHWSHTEPSAVEYQVAADTLRGVSLSLLASTDRSRTTTARFVAQELEDRGMRIEVQPLELGTMIARLNAGDFDMAILQLPELTEPNVLRVFLHGSEVPPAGANRGRVHDAELDALLDRGMSLVDPAARREVYEKVERLMRERLYWIPLWHEDQTAVVGARARTFVPSAEGRWLSLADLP